MSVPFPVGRASGRWAAQANQPGFSLGDKETPRPRNNSQQTVSSECSAERPAGRARRRACHNGAKARSVTIRAASPGG